MDIEHLFSTLTLAQIDEFIDVRQEENLTLDFKLVNRADLSQTEDKRNLAKALSGFANSSGGLVIWGVDARKNLDSVDCAMGKQPITSLSRFIGRLNELTGDFVSPLVDGVRHRTIAVGSDTGFAVTIVPESDSGPH